MTLRPLVVAAAAGLAVALLSFCGDNPPPDRDDAGVDAGADAADAGADAGEDAGDPDVECALGGSDCDAGAACMRYQTTAGDLGTRCFAGACDVVDQDCGAGGDGGLKCTYVPGDGGVSVRACVPPGTAQEGEACTGTATSNSCATGLVCVPRPSADGGNQPVCLKFCWTGADCPAGKTCLLMMDLSPSVERPFVCDTPCDLFAQDCPGTQACYPTEVAPACYPVPGTVPQGGGCAFSSQCVPGAVCVGGTCAALCALPSGAPGCDAGTCTPVNIAGQPDAGACL